MTDTLPLQPPQRVRLVSLDVLRGLTVMGMVLVNNPGDWDHLYWPLEHAPWHGLTPTDLVMPFFLFMVGVSIVYAMSSRREDPAEHSPLLWKIFRRSCLLFLIMYASSLFPNLASLKSMLGRYHAAVDTGAGHVISLASSVGGYYLERIGSLRLLGVLGRIGVVYGVCAVIYLKLSRRAVLVSAVGLVVGYFLLLQFVPVPRVGAVLPGETTRLATEVATSSAGGDVTWVWGRETWEQGRDIGAMIDRAVLKVPHMYAKKVPALASDPEGLATSIAAIATGLLGVLVGEYLKKGKAEMTERLVWLLVVGVVLSLAGFLLGLWMPMNKNLWTPAYTLTTGGLAMLSLASLYWLMDVQGHRRGSGPAIWFGVNAITAFAGSAILSKAWSMLPLYANGKWVGLQGWVNANCIRPWNFSPEFASLLWAVAFVTLWTALVGLMWRLKWTLKV